MLHVTRPTTFEPRFEVASLFLEYGDNLLFLLRPIHKSQGGKWGVPAGKLEPGEHKEEAIVRELKEETGIVVPNDAPTYLNSVFVRHGDYDFVYHMFKLVLEEEPTVVINTYEHERYAWVQPHEAITQLDLITDMGDCIRMYY